MEDWDGVKGGVEWEERYECVECDVFDMVVTD